jgi:large subunit ribosomal protein L23
MILKPVLTEKSLRNAKDGLYTFWVDRGLTKNQIKSLIAKVFSVHVRTARTINYKGGVKRNFKGKEQTIKDRKKAMVTLADKEKIAIFEEKK